MMHRSSSGKSGLLADLGSNPNGAISTGVIPELTGYVRLG